MPTIVLKAERERDFYVGWSTIVEAPVWWGDRAEVTTYLAEKATADPNSQPAARLARADEFGTSDMSIREGGWDDDGLIYEQRGVLPRRRLAELCRLLEAGDERAAWDLLEPFEDLAEVRRG